MERSADGYRKIVQYKKKKWRAAARHRGDWRTQTGEAMAEKVPKSHRKEEDVLPPGLLARQPNSTLAISLFHWNNFNVCVYLYITVLALNVYRSYKWLLRKLKKKN
jgi:hypothetical protein